MEGILYVTVHININKRKGIFMTNSILLIDGEGIKIQAFAPNRILTLAANTPLDMKSLIAIGSPLLYTYYINDDSTNLMTRSGVLIRGEDVTSFTFTKDIVLEVM